MLTRGFAISPPSNPRAACVGLCSSGSSRCTWVYPAFCLHVCASPCTIRNSTMSGADPKPAEPSVVTETVKKEEEVEEPQNELTKKFTEAEWKAVKELRVRLPSPPLAAEYWFSSPSPVLQSQLPSVFERAYPDAKPAPSSITLWGVELSPTAPSAKASVILVKFARARNLVVKDAADMLVNTLKWRDEFKIDEVLKEQFDPEVFGKLGRVYGKDKQGRPVTYNLYGAVTDLKAVFGDVQKFIRCACSSASAGERMVLTRLGLIVQVARAVHGAEHRVARLRDRRPDGPDPWCVRPLPCPIPFELTGAMSWHIQITRA